MSQEVSPFDLDAEKHVLGSILQDPYAIEKAVSVLGEQTNVFYKAAHQLIYGAAIRLRKKNDPIDIYSITKELKDQDELTRVSSVTYIYEIQESVPTAANIDYYAEVVLENATRRALIQAGNEIISYAGRQEVEIEETIDQAQKLIFDVFNRKARQSFSGMKDMMASAIEYFEKVYIRKEPFIGLNTGMPELDMLTKGIASSDLVILAARPSMGKSAFAHNIAANVAFRQDEPVAIFTLEMSKESIINRMLASEAQVDAGKLKTGAISQDEWSRISNTISVIENKPLFINDAAGITIMDIRSEIRSLKIKHPNLKLVIVDYLQLLSGGSKSSQNREQEVAEYSRALKQIARETGIVILALSQLNRAVEARPDKRPLLADLRESGSLEQDSDLVMFLYRDDYYDTSTTSGICELIIRKHRNGPLGTVVFKWYPEYLFFESNDPVF